MSGKSNSKEDRANRLINDYCATACIAMHALVVDVPDVIVGIKLHVGFSSYDDGQIMRDWLIHY